MYFSTLCDERISRHQSEIKLHLMADQIRDEPNFTIPKLSLPGQRCNISLLLSNLLMHLYLQTYNQIRSKINLYSNKKRRMLKQEVIYFGKSSS